MVAIDDTRRLRVCGGESQKSYRLIWRYLSNTIRSSTRSCARWFVMPRDGPTAKAYPTEPQYDRWRDRADELDMSTSEFIQSMVEAGMKVEEGFDVEIAPDESVRELREQRNDMKAEVERLRERVRKLEDRLHDQEREAVKRAVVEGEKTHYESIVEDVRRTATERVNWHLTALEGESIRQNEDGLWEPISAAEGDL